MLTLSEWTLDMFNVSHKKVGIDHVFYTKKENRVLLQDLTEQEMVISGYRALNSSEIKNRQLMEKVRRLFGKMGAHCQA